MATEQGSDAMDKPKHILGMEPDSICRQMIRNHFAGDSGREITTIDCQELMMQFNQWLVLHGCQQLVLVDALERLLKLDSISNRLFARAAIAQTHLRDDGKCEICAKKQVLCKGCSRPLARGFHDLEPNVCNACGHRN